MDHFNHTSDCTGDFADSITFNDWNWWFLRVSRKLHFVRALSILCSALRLDCDFGEFYRFHAQFVWSICGIKLFVVVKKLVFLGQSRFIKKIFFLRSNRFLFGNKALKRAVIFRKDSSIGFIKFIGRQHCMLTGIVDQLNSCYSFQV